MRIAASEHNENLRQLEHLAPIAFAFLLRFLTWEQALIFAFVAVLYAAFVSPRLFRVTQRPNQGILSRQTRVCVFGLHSCPLLPGGQASGRRCVGKPFCRGRRLKPHWTEIRSRQTAVELKQDLAWHVQQRIFLFPGWFCSPPLDGIPTPFRELECATRPSLFYNYSNSMLRRRNSADSIG